MLHMEQTQTASYVAERVSEAIKEHGVTVVWLCERTGIPRSTLNRRLTGAAAFDMNELDRIASALRISTASLLPVVSGVPA